MLKQKQPLAPALPAGHALVTSAGHTLVTNTGLVAANNGLANGLANTHTILVTPSSNASGITPTASLLATPSVSGHASTGHVIVTSSSPNGQQQTFLAKQQPGDLGSGGKLLFSRLSSPVVTSSGLSGTTTLTLASPIKQEVNWGASPPSNCFATNTSYDSTYRAALTSDLISNQPVSFNFRFFSRCNKCQLYLVYDPSLCRASLDWMQDAIDYACESVMHRTFHGKTCRLNSFFLSFISRPTPMGS